MKRMILPVAALIVAVTQVHIMANENKSLIEGTNVMGSLYSSILSEKNDNLSFADMYLLQKAVRMAARLSGTEREKITNTLTAQLSESSDRSGIKALLLSIIDKETQRSHGVADDSSREDAGLASLAIIEGSPMYRPYTKTRMGYGVRIGVKDKEKNAKNIVLQAKIPAGYCFEYDPTLIPSDFTLFSEDNGNTWTKFDTLLVNDSQKEDEFDSSMLCNLTHIKILLPEESGFFGDDAFGFILKPVTTTTKESAKHCISFTATADNAQYVEEKVCIEKPE